jgi:hypothetical protein
MTKDIRDLVEEKKSVGIKNSSPVTKNEKNRGRYGSCLFLFGRTVQGNA